MAEHDTAITMIRESKLSRGDKRDLYEIYLEDAEEHSVHAALDSLASSIRDLENDRSRKVTS